MILKTFAFLLSHPYFLNTNDVLGTAAKKHKKLSLPHTHRSQFTVKNEEKGNFAIFSRS